jgi:hypothetical protein
VEPMWLAKVNSMFAQLNLNGKNFRNFVIDNSSKFCPFLKKIGVFTTDHHYDEENFVEDDNW